MILWDTKGMLSRCFALPIDHQFFQSGVEAVNAQVVHIKILADDVIGLCPPAAPVGTFGRVQPYQMGIFFPESGEPFNAGDVVTGTIIVIAGVKELGRLHLGIANDDDLVFAAEIFQNPFRRNHRFWTQLRVCIYLGIDTVVEIEHLQILKVVGLAHCLEQHGAQTAVIVHGTAAVHEQQYFDGVFPGRS